MATGALLLRTYFDQLWLWPGWRLRSAGAFSALYRDRQDRIWASEEVPALGQSDVEYSNRMHVYTSDGQESVIDLGENKWGYVFAVDQSGTLWISDIGGTIYRRDAHGLWTEIEEPDWVFGFESMVIDWQGRVWARVRLENTSSNFPGYRIGPIEIHPDQATYEIGSSGLTREFVSMLAGDDAGQVWVVQDGELKVLGPDQTWQVVGDSGTACIRHDGEGQDWMCGSQAQSDGNRRGINELIARGWVPGVDSSAITADLQGPGAQRWIATETGLLQFDPTFIQSPIGLLHGLIGHLARFGLLEVLLVALITGMIATQRSVKLSWRNVAKLAGGVATWYVGNTAVLVLLLPLLALLPEPAFFFQLLAVANIISLLGFLLLKRFWLATASILAYFINLAVILSFVQISLRTLLLWGAGVVPFYAVSYTQCMLSLRC